MQIYILARPTTQFFYRPDALPVTQPTASKGSKELVNCTDQIENLCELLCFVSCSVVVVVAVVVVVTLEKLVRFL